MMRLVDILPIARIACNVRASSKKKALELLAELFARDISHLTQNEIFQSLLERERLGTTGLGKGVAIPHARMQCPQLVEGQTDPATPMAAFMRLDNGVAFEAADEQTVDLLFALLIPADGNSAYLEMLSQLAKMLNDGQFCQQLRASDTPESIYQLITQWQAAISQRT